MKKLYLFMSEFTTNANFPLSKKAIPGWELPGFFRKSSKLLISLSVLAGTLSRQGRVRFCYQMIVMKSRDKCNGPQNEVLRQIPSLSYGDSTRMDTTSASSKSRLGAKSVGMRALMDSVISSL